MLVHIEKQKQMILYVVLKKIQQYTRWIWDDNPKMNVEDIWKFVVEFLQFSWKNEWQK